MSKITLILDMLSDGKWHGMEELQLRLGLNEREVQEIATFLNKYTFVKIDEEHRKVRINRNFRKLLAGAIT